MKGYYLMPHPPLIIPEIGRGKESEIQNTIDGCNVIGREIEQSGADTIILITPHGTIFSDAMSLMDTEMLKGDFGKFGAKSVSFSLRINKRLTGEILRQAAKSNIPAVGLDRENAKAYGISTQLDHGAAVPLYFIKNLNKYEIVHITYGMLPPLALYSFGMAVEKACCITGSKAVLIASGDLSHRLTRDGPYPFSPGGKKFDLELVELLKNGDFRGVFSMDSELIAEAGECGLRSVYILAGALDAKAAKADVLSYEGPFGVGYCVAKFNYSNGDSIYSDLENARKARHHQRLKGGNPYTVLARRNLDQYFRTGSSLTVKDIKEKGLLNDKKGVFVSLKTAGELRGCIGTIEAATASVGEEILNNSVSAAFNDPRFSPLREDELYEADISVDLLYPAESCSFEELDPENYGVIVTCGRKRGLLLPQLEGIDTPEEQVAIALKKGGIKPDENYRIQRFRVERFKEE